MDATPKRRKFIIVSPLYGTRSSTGEDLLEKEEPTSPQSLYKHAIFSLFTRLEAIMSSSSPLFEDGRVQHAESMPMNGPMISRPTRWSCGFKGGRTKQHRLAARRKADGRPVSCRNVPTHLSPALSSTWTDLKSVRVEVSHDQCRHPPRTVVGTSRRRPC